ncbi:glycosyltransferase [Colwellia sp. PAMC 21821]|uniref:glycosyltransferase n=1 Tax=Colwellia sp. PAMC 21821 TaxID=1816219 RepID=UPI0009BCDB8D|nr:glycosyltransferase [Colwellia sp. PAMC 21821]ARD43586.1 glycosyl transferase [Colwellia sp. PAMC 21821]
MYDYIIVTHLPAFYKVNLYNALSNKLNIFVVFVSNETSEKRSGDFSSLKEAKFKYSVLSNHAFQHRNKLKTTYKLFKIISNTQYKKILLSGWDLPEFWMVALLSSNNKNCLALESTIMESNISGAKKRVKQLFLSMVNIVFASGRLHVDLLKALNYQKEIRVTHGVGIINKPHFERVEKKYQQKFLFVGRLSKVKNLALLINVFNQLPMHQLTIIGDGEEKKNLMSVANSNIFFREPIENSKLKVEFEKNNFFILPSISETWGIVVEEALYFGLPVIVSDHCGASELIINGINGYIFTNNKTDELMKIIGDIDNDIYKKLLHNIYESKAEQKDIKQVASYDFS